MAETNEATRVRASLGYTSNMGNFESLRIDLSVEDSLRDGENAQAGMDRVYGFAEKNLVEKVQKAREELAAG